MGDATHKANPMIHLLLYPILLAGFTAASVWSVRVACADYWFRQQTITATKKAIAFTPGQADYYFRLALLEIEANSHTAKDTLNRAVALNASDARSWIELGLHYEIENNQRVAERCLLRAAEEDRQYVPRWTLANYYFRQMEFKSFWLWAKEAAAMINGDPVPLFRLCGRVAEDGALMDHLQISRPGIRAAYLSYLLSQNRLDLIRPVSIQLLKDARASDVPLLLATCDRLLESKKVLDALNVWNGLADTDLIPFRSLRPGEGKVMTNGDFEKSPTSHGFDWRLATIDGVSASGDEHGGLRLTFSGGQPEHCEPLVQFVPAQLGVDQELKFEYQTYGIAADSGLNWRITDENGSGILAETHSLSSERVESGVASFGVPAGCKVIRLSLVYRRAPGTTRIQGCIVLRKVRLTSRILRTTAP
jgi:tetratricopeptide (TPR) repeat protein